MMKWGLKLLLFFLCFQANYLMAEDYTISFQSRAHTSLAKVESDNSQPLIPGGGQFLDGDFPVTTEIRKLDKLSGEETVLWSEFHSNIQFKSGFFNVVLGSGESKSLLSPKLLQEDNLSLTVRVLDYTFSWPLTSYPYAIRATQTEMAIAPAAEALEPGTSFVSNVTMNTGLNVIRAKDTWIQDKQFFHQVNFFNKLVTDGFIDVNGNTTGVFPIENSVISMQYLLSNPSTDVGWVDSEATLKAYLQDKDALNEPVTLDSLLTIINSSLWNDTVWEEEKNNGLATRFVINHTSNRVGVLVNNPAYTLDVSGTVNATGFLVNGQPINDTFVWKESSVDSSKIFVKEGSKVGIGTVEPFFNLHIVGGINANKYYFDGSPLEDGFKWTTQYPDPLQTDRYDVYFATTENAKIGIGTSFPVERLHVDAGFTLTAERDASVSAEEGTVQFKDGVFQGYIGGNWYDLPGLTGDGRVSGLSYFVTSNVLGSSSMLYFSNAPPQMTFGAALADSQFLSRQINTDDDYFQITSENNMVFRIGPSGNIGIGTSNVGLGNVINIDGIVDATEILENGVDWRKSKDGDVFKLAADDESIYYLTGHVAIGTDKVLERDDGSTYNNVITSNLKIASPLKDTDIDFPTQDPVIEFSLTRPGDVPIIYGMGIDADDPEVFRVEKLYNDGQQELIGNADPLFAIKRGNFGMGIADPNANLHVSGNIGLMVSGYHTGDQSLPITDNISLWLFDPGKTSFYAGYYETLPSEDVGLYSVSLGKDSKARGIFSVAMGANNEADGAYATSLGGSDNKATGYFSLAMGSHAQANHDGTFVWNGRPAYGDPTVFASKTYNQFLINAFTGVGINTNQTGVSALTINAPLVSSSHFLDLGIDASLALQTFQELQKIDDRGKSYITADGKFKDYLNEFNTNTYFFEFPVVAIVPTSTIYQKLVSIYNASPNVVEETSFVDVIQTDMINYYNTSKSSWQNEKIAEASRQIWKQLEADEFIWSDGQIRNWDYVTNRVSIVNNYLYNPATGLGWASSLNDINDSIKRRIDLGESVVSASFQEDIDTRIYDDTAWQTWIEDDLKPLISKRIFYNLVQEHYIYASGSFNKFRPVGIQFFNVALVPTSDVQEKISDIYTNYMLKTRGLDDRYAVVAKNPNNIAIGMDDPKLSKLAVSGNVVIGKRVASQPEDALITITNYASTANLYSKNFSFAVLRSSVSDLLDPTEEAIHKYRLDNAFLLVSPDGKVGIGTAPDTSSRDVRLKVSSAVKAGAFTFPTGETLSPEPPVLVWQWENTTPNIYFITGNVGIGTVSPNSLLELSSLGRNHPKITFDLDGTDYISYGVDQSKPGILNYVFGTNLVTENPLLTFTNNRVGIGTTSPSADFHIEGKAAVTSLRLSTDNVSGYDFAVDSLMTLSGKKDDGSPKAFFLNGAILSSSGVPWTPLQYPLNKHVIYRETGVNIGIGTATPNADLELIGSLTASGDVVVSEKFRTKGILELDKLKLLVPPFNSYGFYVTANNLVMQSELSGQVFEISKVLAGGEAPEGSLVIVDEDNDQRLKDGLLQWRENENKNTPLSLTALERSRYPAFSFDVSDNVWVQNTDYDIYNPGLVWVTGNFSLTKVRSDVIPNITNSIDVGHSDLNQLVKINSELTYDGVFYEDLTSHNAIEFNFVFSDVWNNGGPMIDVTGLMVSMNSQNGAQITGKSPGTLAYGLVSDVSRVVLQDEGPDTRGFKSSAIFMGDVGIGRLPSRPSTNIYPDLSYSEALDKLKDTYVLEVNGAVTARDFYISDSVILATLNIAPGIMVVTEEGFTGIGTSDPSSLLDVRGVIQSEEASINTGVDADNLSFESDYFRVNSSGFVGLGINQASVGEVQMEVSRNIDSDFQDTFVSTFSVLSLSQEIESDITKNISGVDISLATLESNYVESNTTHRGVNVDFSGLYSKYEGSTTNIIGLSVKMPAKGDIIPTPHAAIFKDGYVGIGTRTPSTSFALDINGTLRAANSTAVNLVSKIPILSVDYLDVTNNLVVGGDMVTMNRLESLGYVKVQSLDLLEESLNVDLDIAIIVDDLSTISTLNVTNNMYAAYLNVLNNADFKKGRVNNQLLIGTNEDSYADAVFSSLRVSADYVIVSTSVQANSLDSNFLKTSEEFNTIDIASTAGFNQVNIGKLAKRSNAVFNAADNSTWSGLRYQVATDSAQIPASILFVVDETTHSGNGAAIAAMKPFDSASGSDLVFLNVTESMRITSTGNIGLSNANPQYLLDVNGNARFTGAIQTNNGLNFSGSIVGLPGMTIHSSLEVPVTTNIDYIAEDDGIYLSSIPSFETVSDSVGLYNESGSDRLIVAVQLGDGTVITTNYTSTLNIAQNKVPYYSSDYQLHESGLSWVTVNTHSVFRVSGNAEIISMVGTTQNETYSEANIRLRVPDRFNVLNSTAFFSGLNVNAEANQLHAEDKLYGVFVDLEELQVDHVIESDGDVVYESHGNKYAGLLNGGYVGIDVSNQINLFRPQAKLHIYNTATNNLAFLTQVEVDGVSRNALSVTQNGFVGIGTNQAVGQLSIAGIEGGNDTLLQVTEVTDGDLLRISKTGLGLGTKASVDLEVDGEVSANYAQFNGLHLDEINVVKGTETLLKVAKNSDLVGFGTADPQAQLHINKTFNEASQSNYIQQAMTVVLATDNHQNDLNGVVLDMNSESDYDFVGGELKQIRGLKVDFSDLNRSGSDTTKWHGLKVDVSTTNTTGTRYGALLQGGIGVGIGTDTPELGKELHVVGGIKANNFIHTGDGIQYNLTDLDSYVITANDIVEISSGSITLQVPMSSFATRTADLTAFGVTPTSIDVTKNETIADLEAYLSSEYPAGSGTGFSVEVQSYDIASDEYSSFTIQNARLNRVVVTTQSERGSDIGNTPSLALTNSNAVIVTGKLTFNDANDDFNFLEQALQRNSLKISQDLDVITGNFITTDGTAPKVAIVGDSNKLMNDSAFTASFNVYGTAAFRGYLNLDDSNTVSANTIVSEESFTISSINVNSTINVSKYFEANSLRLSIHRRDIPNGSFSTATLSLGDQLIISDSNSGKQVITYIPFNRTLDLNALFETSSFTDTFLVGASDTINTIESNLQGVDANLSVISAATAANDVFVPTNNETNYVMLHAADMNLNYRYDNGSEVVTANLTDLIKTPGKVPFYDSDLKLNDTTGVFFAKQSDYPQYVDSNLLRIETLGSGATESLISVNNIISSDEVLTDFSAHKINLGINKRLVASTNVYSALKITPENGTLITDDKIIGSYVDIRNLEARSVDGSGDPKIGYKYAALFRGGSVEIIPDDRNIGLASANLFVRNHGISDQLYTDQLLSTELFPKHRLILSPDGGTTTYNMVIPSGRTLNLSGIDVSYSSSYVVAPGTTGSALQTALQGVYNGLGETWVVSVATPNEIVENFAFQVDRSINSKTETALAIGANGDVGIGVRTANARVQIDGISGGNDRLFELSDVNNGQFVLVEKTGIGIGTDVSDALLTVRGTVSGNYAAFEGLSVGHLNIESNENTLLFVAENSDLVGFGTDTPEAQMHILKNLDTPNLPDYIQQKMDLVLGTDSFGQNLNGLVVNLGAPTLNNSIDGEDNTITGFKVDLSDLNRNGLATDDWVGLYVNVSDENSTGNRIAALFQGDGTVGIGSSNPSQSKALDVVGTIKANNFLHTSNGVSYELKDSDINPSDASYVFNSYDVVTITNDNGSVVETLAQSGNTSFQLPGSVWTINIAPNGDLLPPVGEESIEDMEVYLNANFGDLGTHKITVQSYLYGYSDYSDFTINRATLNNLVLATSGHNNPNRSFSNSPDLYVNSNSVHVLSKLTFTDQTDKFNFFTEAAEQTELEITDYVSANLGILATGDSKIEPAKLVVSSNPSRPFTSSDFSATFNIDGSSVFNGLVVVTDNLLGESDITVSTINSLGTMFFGQTEILATLNIPTQDLYSERISFVDQSFETADPIISGFVVTFDSPTHNDTISYLMSGNPTSVSLNAFSRGDYPIDTDGSINSAALATNLALPASIEIKARDARYSLPGLGTDYGYVFLGYDNLIYKYDSKFNYANLTVSLTGDHKKIPYFNSSQTLSDGTWLSYEDGPSFTGVDTSKLLSLNSIEDIENELFSIENTVSSDAQITNYASQRIFSTFAKRITTSNTTFIGLHVTANLLPDPSVFKEGDSVAGVYVDVSNLEANSSTEVAGDHNSLIGTKYAAVFKGGAVEIITSTNVAGGVSANLNIRNYNVSKYNSESNVISLHDLLEYDNGTTVTKLTVVEKNRIKLNDEYYSYEPGVTTAADLVSAIGLGTITLYKATQNMSLMVKPKSATQNALSVDGYGLVGVGTSDNIALLTIKNTANQSSDYLRLGITPRLIVSHQGYVGLGQDTPAYVFDVQGSSDLLRVQDNDTSSLFAIDQTGIGIGTIAPEARLHVLNKREKAMQVGTNVFTVYATGNYKERIGVKELAPSFSVSVQHQIAAGQFNSLNAPHNWMNNESIGFGAGTVTNNVTDFAFIGYANNEIYESIQDGTYRLKLGDVVSMNSSVTVNVGSTFTSSGKTRLVTPNVSLNELFAAFSAETMITSSKIELYSFQGNLSVPEYNFHINYGGNSTQNFVFNTVNGTKEVMRLDENGYVGILEENPSYNLSLKGESYPVFLLEDNDSPAKFSVSSEGYLGLGELNPDRLMVVSGNIKLDQLIDYPETGTYLTVENSVTVENDSSLKNISYLTTTINSLSGKTAEKVTVYVDGEGGAWGSSTEFKEIIGLDITVSADSSITIPKISNKVNRVYGVKVDLNMRNDSPIEGESDGKLVAAGFISRIPETGVLDTLVGISTLVPSAPLHVQTIEHNSTTKLFEKVSTGDVALFTVSANPLAGFEFTDTKYGSELVITAKDVSKDRYVLTKTGEAENLIITKEDFIRSLMSISFERTWPDTGEKQLVTVRRSTALALLDELKASNLIVSDAKGVYMYTGVLNSIANGNKISRTGASGGAEHYFDINGADGPIPENEIREVLSNIYSRAVYYFTVGDADYAPGTTLGEVNIGGGVKQHTVKYRHTPLILSTGIRPNVYDTDVLSNTFSGMVGINVAEEYIVSPTLTLNDALVIDSPSSGSNVAFRLGMWKPTGDIDLNAPAPKLYFSGGPKLYFEQGSGLDSENSDPLYMRRNSTGKDASSFEFSVGETATVGDVKWVVGYTSIDDQDILTAKNTLLNKVDEFVSQAWTAYEATPPIPSDVYSYPAGSTVLNLLIEFDWADIDTSSYTNVTNDINAWREDQIDAINLKFKNEYLTKANNISTPLSYKQILSMRAATLPDPEEDGEYLPLTGFVGLLDPVNLSVENDSFVPENLLHVKSSQFGGAPTTGNHMMIIENTSDIGVEDSDNIHSLAINYSSISPDDKTNFMTFGIGSSDPLTFPSQIQSLGAIEGNGGQEQPGVAFSSPERDYAEYIPKKDPTETMQPGDIVGIYGGKASKLTQKADQVMVISTSPIIMGNWQPHFDLDTYALIAFLGQVPVKVLGKVNKGDYIVASGKQDGSGIAVSPENITMAHIDLIVGKAWEASENPNEKKILTLVGFPFAKQVAFEKSVKLQLSLDELKEENTYLKETLSSKVYERQEQIKKLKRLIKELKRS